MGSGPIDDAELQPRGTSVTAFEPRYMKTRMFDVRAGHMGVDPMLAHDTDDLALEILSRLMS